MNLHTNCKHKYNEQTQMNKRINANEQMQTNQETEKAKKKISPQFFSQLQKAITLSQTVYCSVLSPFFRFCSALCSKKMFVGSLGNISKDGSVLRSLVIQN